MENSELHEDMLIEIFSRLPAKSVGKFRCLSKAWCSHLSTSQFINLHLTTRKNNQSQLFLENSNNSCYICIPRIEDAGATIKVKLPFTTWCGVVNSCNGLVLLFVFWGPQKGQFILVNPTTLEDVRVPYPELRSETYGFGFGYDSCSDDYKIVIYNWCGVDTNTLDVYSVKSKVWKRASSSPKYPIAMECYKGVFTNGAIHWIAIRNDTFIIVAFNLADEVFYYIPFPASVRDWRFPLHCSWIYFFEGCLCVIDRSSDLRDDIWLMKEYGVLDSWTRFTVNKWVNNWGVYRPLRFIGDEKIVLLTLCGKVIVYDQVEGTTEHLTISTDAVAFSDSLVSLSSDQHVLSS